MYGNFGYHTLPAGNQMCAQCGMLPTKFCLCRDQPIFLCDNCTSLHEYYAHNEVHDSNPITYLSIFYQLGGADAFRMQKRQLAMGQSLVSRMEEFELRQYAEAKQRLDAVTKQYSKWLDYMHDCFTRRVAAFNQEKTLPMTTTQFQLSKFSFFIYSQGEVRWPPDASLVETEPLKRFEADIASLHNTLTQSAGPASDLEDYIISKIQTSISPPPPPPQPAIPIQRAQPAIPIQPSQAPIPTHPVAVQRPPINIVPQQFTLFVPFSRGRLLAKWNSKTTDLDRVQLSRPLNLTNLSVSVVLPDGNIIYCGGKGSEERQCVLVNTTSGQITDLPSLTSGRSNPGIVYSDNFLYLFGGFQSGGDSKPKSGEKFALRTQVWTEFQDKMQSVRYQFSPCEYQRKIYLAGGWETTGVELFDIQTERFSALKLTLPKPFGTTALVNNNDLIILQDSVCIRWRIGSTNPATSTPIGLSVKDSNVCPQVQSGKAYYTRETDTVCEVHRLDCASGSVERVASLSSGGNMPCPVS